MCNICSSIDNRINTVFNRIHDIWINAYLYVYIYIYIYIYVAAEITA